MKKIPFTFLAFMLILFSQLVLARQKKIDSCIFSKKFLIGTWQENSKIVGNGLNQYFQFFSNGTFVLNLYNPGDDARDLIKLKGKYRIDNCSLYFTITSKTIVEGKIWVADAGIDGNLFSIINGKTKELKEPDPKEISDPCYVTPITHTHIKLNNEDYYKVKDSYVE